MRMSSMIWKELWERPTAVCASLLAIVLGVMAFVSIRSMGVSSERAIAGDLQALGANVLMLPKDASLQDYYAADLHEQTIPEEYASRLVFSNLEGLEHVSPRLCVPADVDGQSVTLTGILPQSEFQSKAAWGAVQLFSNKHGSCKRACVNKVDATPESLASNRVIQDFGKSEVFVGADVAQSLSVKGGDRIFVLGEFFNVTGILPETGTVDDGRMFAHLHTVQRIAGTGPVVNAIELMGCCENVAGGLVNHVKEAFPDTKVVTIAQVVETQVSVNQTMNRVSLLIFGVLVAIGGASMATAMYSNVAERRREIGTLMALGATPGFVTQLFLWKAGGLGFVGGIAGAAIGTMVAVVMGPQFLGIPIDPLPSLVAVAIVVSVGISLMASLLPAWRAASLDPCLCFKES